jgi:hypothetical protein
MFRKKLSILLLAVVMVLSISSSAFAQSVQASSNANAETPKKWASVVKRYTYGYYPMEIYYDNGFGWTGNLVAKRVNCDKLSCAVTYEGFIYNNY